MSNLTEKTKKLDFSNDPILNIINQKRENLKTEHNVISSKLNSELIKKLGDSFPSSSAAISNINNPKLSGFKLPEGPVYVLKKEALVKRQNLLTPKPKPATISQKNFTKKSISMENGSSTEENRADINHSTEVEQVDKQTENVLNQSNTSESTSENLIDQNIIKNVFLENFFNRELKLNEYLERDINNNKDITSKKETDDYDLETTSAIGDNDRNVFLDNIFNYIPTNRSIIVDSSRNVVNFKDKLKYIENVRFKDTRSLKLLGNYLKSYEILNNETLVRFRENRKTCKCFKNRLDCCLKNIYIVITKEKSDENRIVPIIRQCCGLCSDFEQNRDNSQLNDKILYNNSIWFNYLKNLDLIYLKDILSASSLLNDYYETYDWKIDCLCESKVFKCCLETIYDVAKSNNDHEKMPLHFFDSKCCFKCGHGAAKSSKIISNVSKSIFIKALSEDDDATDVPNEEKNDNDHNDQNRNATVDELKNNVKSKDVEEVLPKNDVDHVDHFQLLNPNESLDQTFDLLCSPRSSILNGKMVSGIVVKKVSENLPDKKENVPIKSNLSQVLPNITQTKPIIKSSAKNSIRPVNHKSVTFIEDPKFGFLPVEIPEWQENLREPVYSGKFKVSLEEWKS